MARETWAVYSVADHCVPYAFTADVLFYDRLRVPTATPDDRDRWIRKGWDPDRQDAFMQALGDRAAPVAWDERHRDRWATTFAGATASAGETSPDGFMWTRQQLIEDLPRRVTGVDTVAAYPDLTALADDTKLKREPDIHPGPGLASAVMAAEFAIPAAVQMPAMSLDQELEVLNAALDISGRKAYQRNRRAYWRWLREFTDGVVTDIDAVTEAVDELQDLMAEQAELVRDARIDTAVRTCFLASTVSLGLLAAPAAPVIAGATAAVALGQFTWSELRARREPGANNENRVLAMFCQIDRKIRKEFFSASG